MSSGPNKEYSSRWRDRRETSTFTLGCPSELGKHGVEKTGEQYRNKVKKLCQEYKKIKDNHNQMGTGKTKWKSYVRLNEISGNRPATCPPVILDMLTDDSTVASDEISDENEDGAESDDLDDPELTSSRSATVSKAATTVSSAVIKEETKMIAGRND